MYEVENSLRELIFQESLSLARKYLLSYKSRSSNVLPEECREILTRQKNDAVSRGEQFSSKAIWCMETIGKIQDSFVSSILQLKEGAFKESWSSLGECKNQISQLDKHFTEVDNEFGIEHIRTHVKQIRELYPLHVGISPGLLIREKTCSICDTKLTLRAGCEHNFNEIYDGEMCHAVVTQFELLHVALVDNPAQNSTYIWPEIDGNPSFEMLTFLAKAWNSPWDRWSYTKEERRSFHPLFKNIGRNDLCPCGSGLKYKRCCLKKDTVPEFPHFQFLFDQKPRGTFPELQSFTKNS